MTHIELSTQILPAFAQCSYGERRRDSGPLLSLFNLHVNAVGTDTDREGLYSTEQRFGLY
jgi:hypothetical protein